MFYLSVTAAFIMLVTLLVNVNFGILAAFLLKPVTDTSYLTYFGGIRLPELVGVAVPLLVLMRSFTPGQKLSEMPLFRIWLIYLIYNVLTFSIIAFDRGALSSIGLSFRVLNGFVGFYMIQAFFHDRESFRRLLLVIILAGLFPMATGVYQALTGVVWHERMTVGLVRNVGLYHDSVTFRNYAFQTLSAVFLFWFYFLKPGRDIVKRTLLLILVSACLVVLYKVYSKAGITILTLWILIYCVSHKRIVPAILSVGLLVGINFLYQGQLFSEVEQLFWREVAATMENADELAYRKTLSGRWSVWEFLLQEFASRPLVFQILGNGNTGNAHNDFLIALFSGGVVGLFIYVVLLGSIGMRILKNFRRRPSPLNVMAIMIFAMWLVDTLGLSPSLYPAYQWYVWGFIGLSLRGLDWEPVAIPVGPGPSTAIGVAGKDLEAPPGRRMYGRRAPARRPLTRKV